MIKEDGSKNWGWKSFSSLGDVGKNIASGLSSFTGIGDGKDFVNLESVSLGRYKRFSAENSAS